MMKSKKKRNIHTEDEEVNGRERESFFYRDNLWRSSLWEKDGIFSMEERRWQWYGVTQDLNTFTGPKMFLSSIKNS